MASFFKSGIRSNKYKKKKKEISPDVITSKKGLFSKNIAMDLGTANTLIYLQGVGLVLQEPSVVAYDANTMEILAAGKEAKSYIGRTPLNIKVVKPLESGIIEDIEITQAMIREFFAKVQKMSRFLKPKAVVCVPAGITKVEEKAIVKAASESGIGRLFMIEEPIAAAIGAGLDIDKNRGQMVVNIGGGITDIAVLSMSSIAYSDNIRTGGDTMTKCLLDYILSKYSMKVGENSAEEAKIESCSTQMIGEGKSISVYGKDAVTSIPKVLNLSADEIRQA
ncbi:MAG TPA: rod shape-determining protein, partial [Flavobacteriales bacterium]|nr:rod shape-determining protein [Flavobacteriales bacterium]